MAPNPSKTMRLPPLKILRVRNPKLKAENPCVTAMSSVLSCWAASGFNAAGCAAVENQLRKCMDGPQPPPPPPSSINFHLARMKNRVINSGNHK